eukprot:4247226-Pyramimonas_sp.AAC.1
MPGCLQETPPALQDDPMYTRPRSSRKLFEGARAKLVEPPARAKMRGTMGNTGDEQKGRGAARSKRGGESGINVRRRAPF